MTVTYEPSEEGIRHLEHTADLWIEATGKDVKAVISRMVEGIYRVMASEFLLEEGSEELTVEGIGPDIETALVKVLSGILLLFDAEGRILRGISSEIEEREGVIAIILTGEACQASIPRGKGGMEVKAVTYHGTVLTERNEEMVGTILLDL